jgi:L-lactate dehydrogenase complex protein LldG
MTSAETGTSTGTESGDRAAFLARLADRLAGGVPENVAHPLPPPLTSIPVVRSNRLDPDDLAGSFVRNATATRAVVHDVPDAQVSDDLIADLVARHNVRRAVVSREEEALRVGARLAGLGVTVAPLSTATSAAADLGVTSAVAAFATTGTVVQDSHAAGGRTASLLPPVHLCVLPVDRIVASSADLLRRLGDGRSLPSNLVLITGPSRSGDIEQIMALGVHGPLAVEIVLLRG